jgi:hypothetical protein
MAGVPAEVARRADELLAAAAPTAIDWVAGGEGVAASGGAASSASPGAPASPRARLVAADERDALPAAVDQVLLALASINIAATTPLDGLNLLYSLQQRALAFLHERSA